MRDVRVFKIGYRIVCYCHVNKMRPEENTEKREWEWEIQKKKKEKKRKEKRRRKYTWSIYEINHPYWLAPIHNVSFHIYRLHFTFSSNEMNKCRCFFCMLLLLLLLLLVILYSFRLRSFSFSFCRSSFPHSHGCAWTPTNISFQFDCLSDFMRKLYYFFFAFSL